jgi:cytidine deaminase
LGEIILPRGMCRELNSDYSPEACVVVLRSDQPTNVLVMALLPDKYSRRIVTPL